MIQFTGSFQSGGYNMVGTGNGDTYFNQTGDVTNASDPDKVTLAKSNLGSLGDNGGRTQTVALLGNNPAINGGDPAVANSATLVD